MEHPEGNRPATAREIILEIVRNMREGREPLQYTTLPPAIFHVYLYPDDKARLDPILPSVKDEACRALDEELATLNRASLAEKLKLSRRGEPPMAKPESGWQVEFLENHDDDAQTGDIVVSSELALPAKPEFGGSLTRRIATRRIAGRTLPAETTRTAAVAPDTSATLDGATSDSVVAIIDYADDGGRKQYRMCKDQIVVGRGGKDYWTDLKLESPPDVSREHIRLRRDAGSGDFYLKDLSRLGTTINGERVPSSIEFSGGEKRDRNLETRLPAAARIGLAGVVFLDFRAGGKA